MSVSKMIPLVLFSMVLFGCAAVSGPQAGASTLSATETSLPATVVTATPTPTFTSTWTLTPTSTFTPAPTASQTWTPTATPVPTYAILRGMPNEEKVSCRYGPGAMYLFLYPLLQGSTQDIIGRTDTGHWLLTRSHGDNKSCWIKASLLDVKGDIMSLQVVYPEPYHIPPSNQHYLPPWDVAAIRHGDQVVISWKSEALRPGDEESATSVLYVVEVWTCQAGQVTFLPVGAYGPQVTVTDEPGCSQSSHGRVFFSEKHGYTGPSNIPWPSAGSTSTPTPTP